MLGGGPTGVELAQVYARYGVPTTIVEHNDAAARRAIIRATRRPWRRASGPTASTVRTGVRALRARAGARTGRRARRSTSTTAPSVVGPRSARSRSGGRCRWRGWGSRTLGLDISKERPWPADGRLRIADGLCVIGDPAGPEMHTHTAHYQGEMADPDGARRRRPPDYTALPRCTYTDPEAAFVGLTLEQAARPGRDAFELVADLGTTAKGYVAEASGHVTIVVDRAEQVLLGRRDRRPRRHRGDPRGGARDQDPHADRRAGRHDPRVPDHGAGAGRLFVEAVACSPDERRRRVDARPSRLR